MSGGAPWERRQVGPGFNFRGSKLQNTFQNTLQVKTLQSTLLNTLQINGKSNNKEHTARQCDYNEQCKNTGKLPAKKYKRQCNTQCKKSQNRIEKQNRMQRTLQ